MFKKLFGNALYVQIWENRIKVTDMLNGTCFDEQPLLAVQTDAKGGKSILAIGNAAATATLTIRGATLAVINPFAHPRSLLADFTAGEKLLHAIFRKLHGSAWFRPAPQVVIQAMEKLDGGLTAIERRAFRELAAGAGAREVIVYDGPPLSPQNFDFAALKKQDKDFT